MVTVNVYGTRVVTTKARLSEFEMAGGFLLHDKAQAIEFLKGVKK
jgi:hypothetical protein